MRIKFDKYGRITGPTPGGIAYGKYIFISFGDIDFLWTSLITWQRCGKRVFE